MVVADTRMTAWPGFPSVKGVLTIDDALSIALGGRKTLSFKTMAKVQSGLHSPQPQHDETPNNMIHEVSSRPPTGASIVPMYERMTYRQCGGAVFATGPFRKHGKLPSTGGLCHSRRQGSGKCCEIGAKKNNSNARNCTQTDCCCQSQSDAHWFRTVASPSLESVQARAKPEVSSD